MAGQRLFETLDELFAAYPEQVGQLLTGMPAMVTQEMSKQFLLAWMDLARQSIHHPGRWAEMVTRFPVEQMNLWWDVCSGETSGAKLKTRSEAGDRRFAGKLWQTYPLFNYLKSSYLLASDWLTQLAEHTELDARDKQRLMFYLRQFIDALSPSNFLATNPEALQLALESQGQSLLKGLQNLLADVRKGHISMTDESAFKLGENLAATPARSSSKTS